MRETAVSVASDPPGGYTLAVVSSPVRRIVAAGRWRICAARHAVARQQGQTTTEWAIVAGLLAALGIFIGAVLPAVLGAFIRAIALSVRTIAP